MSESELLVTTKSAAKFARIKTLEMTSVKKASHIGSCFSVIDVLSVLFAIKSKSKVYGDSNVILSKGHAAAALYAVLKFFKKLDSNLEQFCDDDSKIYGHVNHLASSEIQLSTGSLGHGLPFAIGIALADKLKGNGTKTFVVISDGELNEGTTWESALFAGHHKIENLVVIIDRNRIQSLGSTEETLKLEPIDRKWEAFDWEVVEIDGHSHEDILETCLLQLTKPLCVIANTTKGKGVSFMENKIEWHYKSASDIEFKDALAELEGVRE